ncbi:MAG: 3-hydroxyacyl-CoA dehydrogenase NAD-binding domain-containing protein [Nitrospirales bacterium]
MTFGPGHSTQPVERIRKGYAKQRQEGLISSSEEESALRRIHTTHTLVDLADRHLILETAPEILEIKCDLFRQLKNNL